MTTRTVLYCFGLVVAGAVALAQQGESLPGNTAKAPPTDKRHYSYAVGLDVGSSFRADNLELDVDSLVAGVRDGLSGAPPKYSEQLLAAAIQRLTEQRVQVLRQRSETFLTQNAKQPGVQSLPSGLQYKVIKSGQGATPGPEDRVRVHYHGQLLDGTVFDTTQGREPITLKVSDFIPGWSEALQRMKVGDKWQLFIPSNLAYGEEGFGEAIPPYSALVFVIELVAVVK